MKKSLKSILILSIIIINSSIILPEVFGQDIKYENISEKLDGNVLCLKMNMKNKCLYAGTDQGLYVRKGDGDWIKAEYFSGKVKVHDISFDEEKLFFVTDHGIYKENKKGVAELISRKKDINGILTSNCDGSEKEVYVWSNKNIFKLKNGYTEDITPEYLKGDIKNIIRTGNSRIFVATSERIYKLEEDKNRWEEIFLVKSEEKEEVEEDPELLDEEQAYTQNIIGIENFMVTENNIDAWKNGTDPDVIGSDEVNWINSKDFTNMGCIVCTVKGLFILDENGVIIKRIGITGFPANNIKCAVQISGSIIAATDKNIFVYDFLEEMWRTYFERVASYDIDFLKVYERKEGDEMETIYVVSGKEILEIEEQHNMFSPPEISEEDRFIEKQKSAPSIRVVQDMAVAYAEVSPDKIKAWRNGARWKAILPKLSLSYSESIDANVEIYKSASKYYIVSGPREIDNDWSVDLSWDLSDIIWSSSQTSIDVRSKLMVQLRNEILEDITRLYFERQRAIEALTILTDKLKNEAGQGRDRSGISAKALRVKEINSYIDALTGGKFSEALKN